jgi:adenylosuccinate lyase
MAATQHVRAGGANDLLARIAADTQIGLDLRTLEREMNPRRFVGCAPQQVTDYLAKEVRPALRVYRRVFPADDAGVTV